MMRILFWMLRSVPFFVILGTLALGFWKGLQPPPPAPLPELPVELQIARPPPDKPREPPPEPPAGAALEAAIEVPESVPLGDPVPVTLVLTNSGTVALQRLVLFVALPEGTRTQKLSREIRFNLDQLAPGETVRREALIITQRPGTLDLRFRVRSGEGVRTEATATVRLPAALLRLEAVAAAKGAAETCVRLTNHGNAPARRLLVRLVGDSGSARLLPDLAPDESTTVCFPGRTGERGILQVEATATAADPARLKIGE